MALVIISGRGSDVDYVALSKEDFVRLTEESVDSDTIEDLLDSSDTESGPINGVNAQKLRAGPIRLRRLGESSP